MGGGVDEGGRGEGVAEGEGGVGEGVGREGVLGGDQQLAWGGAGDLNVEMYERCKRDRRPMSSP